MKYLYQVRWWMRLYSSHLVWRIHTNKKEVFLTFDDGPNPQITPWVLETLKKHNAKATFFCIGNNVTLYPNVFKQILSEGHQVGNHTFNHEVGWKTEVHKYVNSVNKCESVFGSPFFRPPHGRITRRQIRALKDRYKIIMWSLMSGDFDQTITPTEILEYLQTNVKKGDIIVFHDSEKAKNNLEIVLPQFLQYLKEHGFICSVLTAPKSRTFS